LFLGELEEELGFRELLREIVAAQKAGEEVAEERERYGAKGK
jgi:hypothetical protein